MDRAKAQAKRSGPQAKEGNPETRRAVDGLALKAKVENKRKAAEEAEKQKKIEDDYKRQTEINQGKVSASAPAAAPRWFRKARRSL